MWKDYKGSRALGVPIPVLFLYSTNQLQSGSAPVRDFLQKVSEVELDVVTLGAFLRCVRYGPSERLAYSSTIAGCADNGVLLRVSLSTIKSWYKLGLLRLIRDMEVDPVLAFLAVGCLTEVGWSAMGDQVWFPYKYAEGKI